MNTEKNYITLVDADGFETKYQLMGQVVRGSTYYIIQPEGKKYLEVLKVSGLEGDISSGELLVNEMLAESILEEYNSDKAAAAKAVADAMKAQAAAQTAGEVESPDNKNANKKGKTAYHDRQDRWESNRKQPIRSAQPSAVTTGSGEIEVEFTVPHQSNCSEIKKEQNYFRNKNNRDDAACRELERERKKMNRLIRKEKAKSFNLEKAASFVKDVVSSVDDDSTESTASSVADSVAEETRQMKKAIEQKVSTFRGSTRRPSNGQGAGAGIMIALLVGIFFLFGIIAAMSTTGDDFYYDGDYEYYDDEDYEDGVYFVQLNEIDIVDDGWADYSNVGVTGYIVYKNEEVGYATMYVGDKDNITKRNQLVKSDDGYMVGNQCILIMDKNGGTLQDFAVGDYVYVEADTSAKVSHYGEDEDVVLHLVDISYMDFSIDDDEDSVSVEDDDY